jgi:hypothetical protein
MTHSGGRFMIQTGRLQSPWVVVGVETERLR